MKFLHLRIENRHGADLASQKAIRINVAKKHDLHLRRVQSFGFRVEGHMHVHYDFSCAMMSNLMAPQLLASACFDLEVHGFLVCKDLQAKGNYV